MAGKRQYDDPCGVARALDLVGERWALLVVRELLFGAKRFSDLSRGLDGMSQNVLAQRLRELEGSGVLRRRRLGPPVSATVYELTERGAELEPVLLALAHWGSRTPLTSDAELSTDALLLAMKSTFDPSRADGLRASLELWLADDVCTVRVADGAVALHRGAPADPDLVLHTDPATLRALVFGGRSLPAALRAGSAALRGDTELAARLLRAFPRPA